MSQEKDPAIVFLPSVRLSFPHLFEAHAMQDDQEAKYSVTLLFDNEKHGKLLDQIDALAERLALDVFKKKIRLTRDLLRDGNEKSDMDGYGDGVTFMTASRKTRPVVVDANLNPLTAGDNVIYAGCYCNVTVRLWVQNNKWGKSVNAELRGVQFVKDGESFGAAPVKAEDEFKPIGDSSDDTGSSSPRSSRSARGGNKASASIEDF